MGKFKKDKGGVKPNNAQNNQTNKKLKNQMKPKKKSVQVADKNVRMQIASGELVKVIFDNTLLHSLLLFNILLCLGKVEKNCFYIFWPVSSRKNFKIRDMLCSKLTEATLKVWKIGKTYDNSSVPQQPPIDIEFLLRDCVNKK